LNLGAHRDLHLIDQPLRKFLRILGDVAALRPEREIEQCRGSARVGDAVGDLALDRHFLEVGGDLRKNEGLVHARGRHHDHRGRRREIPEGQAGALLHGTAISILDDVLRGFSLDEAKS
jgi:hypothetical protein